jgi:uncharacterized membrane protein
MVFWPHYGKRAAGDVAAIPAPAPIEPLPVRVSPRTAFLDAWTIFCRNPLLSAVCAIPLIVIFGATAAASAAISHDVAVTPDHTVSMVWLAGREVRADTVEAAVFGLMMVFIGWPLGIGLMACAVDSARAGEPRLDRLLVGFRNYLTSLAWGLLATLLGALGVLIIPIVFVWPYLWLATAALAERRRGIPDTLGVAWAAYTRSFGWLVLTWLLTGVVVLAGGFLFGAGLFIAIPVAGLMLGVAYRDAVVRLETESGAPH